MVQTLQSCLWPHKTTEAPYGASFKNYTDKKIEFFWEYHRVVLYKSTIILEISIVSIFALEE
jgi:hypothetical protein